MTGDGTDRTTPVGLFNTARSYWQSAEYLEAAQLRTTHPTLPVTFLFCHAIELYLKAYLRASGRTLIELKQIGHRVSQLAEASGRSGLLIDAEHSEVLSRIDETDTALDSRYIVTGFKEGPTKQTLSSVAETLDRVVCEALIAKRFQVRAEKFKRPQPSEHPKEANLAPDTVRVLVYLFDLGDSAQRVDFIAKALQMKMNAALYHIERLKKAELVRELTYNNCYITPDGRRYVVEHELTSGAPAGKD